MKKLVLSASLIATFMLYVVYVHQESPSGQIVFKNLADIPRFFEQRGIYKDGEYLSKVIDVYYGNLEFKAIVKGGRLVDIEFLQFPNDRKTSIDISAYALPILLKEAVEAQSATVDIVSGATQTSDGFVQALGGVLEQAKA